MAVARVNSEMTVTGNEASLTNFDNNAGSLGQGATKIDVGANPVRRVIILKTAKLIIVGTGSDRSVESKLSWDPTEETMYVSDDSPNGASGTFHPIPGAGGAIEVRKGGHLDIGSESAGTDGPNYSNGDGLVIAKKGSAASDIATGAIYAQAGSKVTLKGVAISVAGAFRLEGAVSGQAANVNGAACVFVAKDVKIYVEHTDALTADQGYFAPRLYTDDYQVDGWHQIGGTLQIQARKNGSFIRNIIIDQMQGGVSITGNNFGADATIYVLEGVTGGRNSQSEVVIYNGRGGEIRGSANGSLIKGSLQSLTHFSRSYGFLILTQPVEITVKDAAGNPVQGARVHYEDTVTGRGHVDWPANTAVTGALGQNPQPIQPPPDPNFTVQGKGSELTDVNGKCTFLVRVAGMVFLPANIGSQTVQEWKEYGITNVHGDNRFLFHVDSYLHLGADSPVKCAAVGTATHDFALVDDPTVTQQNINTVASWNGFTTDHVADYITMSGQSYNLDNLRDWLKRDKTLAGSEVHPTRAGAVASADGTVLDLGGYGLGLDSTAVLNPGEKFRSVRTTGTIDVATGGQINVGYQDASGKSILIRLGAPQTHIVYDTGGAATHVAGGLHELYRISLPPSATLNLLVSREGFYYRKYTFAVADITEIAVTLFPNPNIDDATVINGVDITTYPQTLDGLYANNIGFDKSNNVLIPSNVRLGNYNTSGKKPLQRKLMDRLMNTQAALEAIHAHNDSETRAFEIRQDELMIDQRWIGIDRQAVSVPPNPAQGDGTAPGTLEGIARFGLYVVHWDNITPYQPRNIGGYYVAIDPYNPSTGLSQVALLNVGRALATEDAVVDGIADAVDIKLTPELRAIDDDVGGVSRQIDALPIDKLLNEAVSVYNVPLSTATPNIFTGAPGSSYSLVGGNLQIDFAQTVPDNVSDISLSLEGLVAFALPIPVDNDLVLQVTVRAQALTGGARHIDPDFVWEWTLGAGASTDLRRRMGFLKESHVGQVLATVGGLGPASIIEFEVGRPASSIDITGADLGMDPPVRNANEHLRIVITRVEWVRKHTASLDDFKADIGEINTDVTAIKAKTDGLNFTGDDVKATLDGETAVTDISTLATLAKQTDIENKLDAVNPTVSILPFYVTDFRRGTATNDGTAAGALQGSGSYLGMGLTFQEPGHYIAIFAVDDMESFVKGVVKFTRSGMLNHLGAPIAAETPCGNGEFQMFLAKDVNGFADEAAWIAFNNANNPIHEENYGESGEAASIFGNLDVATVPQTTKFNRIIIRWYRSDFSSFYQDIIRIRLSNLRVEVPLQVYDEAITKNNLPIVKKFIANRRRADPVTKQLTIYEDDKMTAALVKRLKDAAGNPTDDPAEEDPI